MKIRAVDAVWLHVPLPADKQHVSDFGRIAAFDAVLVTVTTECGLVGHGEAKPAVGSAGDGRALVAIVENELRPRLLGRDPREVGRAFGLMYNGSRAGHAERTGRAMPILGRRGASMAVLAQHAAMHLQTRRLHLLAQWGLARWDAKRARQPRDACA